MARRVSVSEFDPKPSGYSVELSVEVTKETAVAGNPARILVTVFNHGGDHFKFVTGHPGVFDGLHSEQRDPGLFLWLTGNRPPIAISGGEVETTGYPIPGYAQPHDLGPNERQSVELDVLSEKQMDPWGWVPKGAFTFRAEYTVGPVKETVGTFDWGFVLDVQ